VSRAALAMGVVVSGLLTSHSTQGALRALLNDLLGPAPSVGPVPERRSQSAAASDGNSSTKQGQQAVPAR
jgi:hypothetical protein